MALTNGQWGWSEMEELLQCPICFDPPSGGVVEQCIFGHHICSNCKPKVESCPLCKCSYSGTRNFVVEELMRNFEILKNTMLLSAITDGKKSTKTSKPKPPLPVPKPKLPSTPNATKGVYPCGFRNCDVRLHSGRLLNHVRSFHSKFLQEAALNEAKSYNAHWMLNCTTKNTMYIWQRAIFITGIGLVFFTYELLSKGYVILSVQMSSQYKLSNKYKVKITAQSPARTYTHSTKLVSTREKIENLLYKNACLFLDDKMVRAVADNKTFKCTLEFSPCQADEVVFTDFVRPNVPKWFFSTYKSQLPKLPKVKAEENNKQKNKKR